MRQGKSLADLDAELKLIKETSRDLVVPTRSMTMVEDTSIAVGDDLFAPTDWSHAQIGTYSKIPKQYYDKIRNENPGLLASNVNHGFQMAINKYLAKNKDTARMLRTVNGKLRGFLSSRYRRLDCYDMLCAVLPILHDGNFVVRSCQLTDKKMYLKAVCPYLETEVKPGFPVNYGLSVASSDVGCSSAQISPFMEETVCTNGMTMEQAVRKYHIGKDQASDGIEELLSDETKKQADLAFWMEVKDVVRGTMKRDVFEQQVNKLREAAGAEIKNFKMEKVVELAMKEVNVTGEEVKNSIMDQIINGSQGRGRNQWGMGNAFTWAAQNVETLSYDEASELERAGGKIIELPRNKWERIAA